MNFHVAAGTVIDGRYRVISRVGSGGMADVYCAEDTQLGRRIAVKLLHERFAQDEEFVERFRREASSAAGLSHANIVSVYDRGEWGDTYYIAMEYLDGRSLDSIVREEAPLAPERAIEITEQVLRAARFAHRRGVVHRDLKPHNVIIDGEGRVKVTDFGIARAGASEITQTGSIMGTARYLSPEQAQGQAVSPRSDLYSVGIMLYELLTGTVPFEGDSVVAIALRHLSEPPRLPSSLVPSISPSLDAIVMRALAKSPEQRFADADEFLAALEDERERSRQAGGSLTAALAPVVVVPPPYQSPATYTTQAMAPLRPVTGSYPVGPAYWDPNTTGIIPPGTIMLPPAGRRGPVWPWALLGAFVAAAAIVALVFVLTNDRSPAVVATRVPNVLGQSRVDAQANLQAAGFVPITVTVNSSRAAGAVVKQIPGGGQPAKSGSTVVLHVSGGRGVPSTLQVPNVVGASGASATQQLHGQGFRVSTAKMASTTVAKNTVISTIPAGGSTAPRGSTVVLTVSSGPPSVGVPNVVGETAAQARLLLQARLFTVATVKQPSPQPPGTVLKQTPASGKAPQGATVTLTVAQPLPNVTVPYLIGLTAAQAVRRLGKLGLPSAQVPVIREKNPAFDNLVLHQAPHAGASVPPGTLVSIRIEHYVAPPSSTTTATSTTASTTASTTTPGPGASGASGASGATGATGPG